MKVKKTEEELLREGFRKITAWYHGLCSFCDRPYSAGEEIYWKRDPRTTVCCPRCYGSKARTKRKVACPECHAEFFIEV